VVRLKLVLFASLMLVLSLSACNPNANQPAAKPAAPTAVKPAASTAKPASTGLPTPTGQRPVVVGEPKAQQTVKSPLHISGLAMVFEGTVRAEVVDAKGTVLGRGFTTASVGAPEVGTFAFDIQFPGPAQSGPGTVRIYGDNPRDGSHFGQVEIPITLAAK
jgi:hypothetical protein